MKKLLIIDGNSILNRAFYGIKLLTNKEGFFTNAIYGMATIIERHISNLSPDYCAVAFDLKAPTFRHKMYDGYKANRKGMPDELAVQLPYAKDCMTYMGCRVVTLEGYEADDILGTFSRMADEEGIHTYILTGDRDSLQLICDNTSVLLAKTKETVEFDRTRFKEEYGIEPHQFVDVKALMGDSSDNIPGVAGIGEKTALKLISEFGGLDELYDKYADSSLTAGVKQKLSDGKDKAYMSQTLARIDKYAPVNVSVEDCRYNGFMKKELFSLFAKLDFFALIKKFGLENADSCEPVTQARADDGKTPLQTAVEAVVLSSKELLEALGGKKAGAAFDDDGKVVFFDGEKRYAANLNDAFDVFKRAKVAMHGIKDVYRRLLKHGYTEKEIGEFDLAFDTMLAAYVLDATQGDYSLEKVLLSHFGEAISEVMTADTAVFKLWKLLDEKIEFDGCHSLLYDIELPLAKVLAKMEHNGFKVDIEGLEEYGKALNSMAEDLKHRIYSYAGEEFNIGSPKQLGEVLFEKMMLPSSKKTKNGYSTDADVLKKLLPHHPIIEDILDYRQVTKLRSTYAEGLVKAADAKGKVHSVFNQTGTATGRLSSSEPNLQNIPVRTELGKEFRKYFIPEGKGRVIIDADYSQIELRILAHISGDENMINAFLGGEDIHTMTAARVFGVEPQAVTSELRKRAKAVNFGILYGMGEFSLSEDLGISRVQAKKYIESYLAGFPKISQYLDRVKEEAHRDGYVSTMFGRRRRIAELASSNKNMQHFGERVAMNSPIQGTAADIIKLAMVRVSDELEKSGIDAKMILQVHDELLVESSRECADEAYRILTECMEQSVKLSVPLDVDAHIGENWYEAK